nr:hypothetical protein [Elizabethkingia sp. ASV34]
MLNTIFKIPATFRGNKFKYWQYDKLKAEETCCINGLFDKYGKPYQGYPSKEQQANQKNPNQSNQRKL